MDYRIFNMRTWSFLCVRIHTWGAHRQRVSTAFLTRNNSPVFASWLRCSTNWATPSNCDRIKQSEIPQISFKHIMTVRLCAVFHSHNSLLSPALHNCLYNPTPAKRIGTGDIAQWLEYQNCNPMLPSFFFWSLRVNSWADLFLSDPLRVYGMHVPKFVARLRPHIHLL